MSNQKLPKITWCTECGEGMRLNGNCPDEKCAAHFTECEHGEHAEGCGKCHRATPTLAQAPASTVLPEHLKTPKQYGLNREYVAHSAYLELFEFVAALRSAPPLKAPGEVEGEIGKDLYATLSFAVAKMQQFGTLTGTASICRQALARHIRASRQWAGRPTKQEVADAIKESVPEALREVAPSGAVQEPVAWMNSVTGRVSTPDELKGMRGTTAYTIPLIRGDLPSPASHGVREALEFYASPCRYEGPNQRAFEGDKFTDSGSPFMQDVGRDGGEIARRALAPIGYKTITIPACAEHAGFHAITVTVPWVCLECGGPRGEPSKGLSYDGSRRLSVDMWNNPCGHIEKYGAVRASLGPDSSNTPANKKDGQ